MSYINIPIDSQAASLEFTQDLEGVTYLFQFQWNQRMEVWIMNLMTEDRIDIVSGVPLLLGVALTARFADSRLPPGQFLLVDTSETNRKPERTEMGERVQLVYIESETVAAL